MALTTTAGSSRGRRWSWRRNKKRGNMVKPKSETGSKHRRSSTLTILAVTVILILGFAYIFGPWIQRHLPIVNEVFTLIEEQDINSNGYFYTEIEGAYAGEKYLRDSIRLADPSEARLNFAFISGVVICILILGLGYRYLPVD